MHAAMTDTSRQDRTEWALLGTALLVLGIALGSMLVAARHDIDVGERDRLQVQARVIADNLGHQLEAVDHALLDVQAALAPSHRWDREHSEAHFLAVLRRAIPAS